jgi:predicted small lipoprotein YifL
MDLNIINQPILGKRMIRPMVTLMLCGVLTACGQKGPLTLPKESSTAAQSTATQGIK